MLGRLFNQMTRQLKGQREALMDSHRQTERRRRLFDSVLSNVTAGVIGLDAEGRVDFVNRAAERLLDIPDDQHEAGIGAGRARIRGPVRRGCAKTATPRCRKKSA